MKGNGLFIEKHHFIQSISPCHSTCGGFVILGREKGNILQLIAIRIPFGSTLLVDAMAIHGDSTLTGLFVMSMTGNHHAMATADTVFLKHKKNATNVRVSVDKQTCDDKADVDPHRLALTSNKNTLEDLKTMDKQYRTQIEAAVGSLSDYGFVNMVRGALWQPVMWTPPTGSLRGWEKTLGTELPSKA